MSICGSALLAGDSAPRAYSLVAGTQRQREERPARGGSGCGRASRRTSPRLVCRWCALARHGGDNRAGCERGLERPVSSARLGIWSCALGTDAQRKDLGPRQPGETVLLSPQYLGSVFRKGRSCILRLARNNEIRPPAREDPCAMAVTTAARPAGTREWRRLPTLAHPDSFAI